MQVLHITKRELEAIKRRDKSNRKAHAKRKKKGSWRQRRKDQRMTQLKASN
jgi:hypothetical protein